MTGRLTAFLAVVGALGIALAGLVADAPAVQALGWAAVAGVGLSAMLRGPGLRIMGGVGALLALVAAVSAALAGGWAWIAVAFTAVLLVAAFSAVIRGPLWRTDSTRATREPLKDVWKQFDAGEDPTTDAGGPDERDPR